MQSTWSMPNDQGGHEAMSLSTGKKITPNRVFEIPVTNTVIKHVEAMADAQGIKSLKLTNRLKTRFYPADWITGVDYDPENPETYKDEEYEDYKHEDSDEDSWVNPDEDRMSPEREEQWRADLEAWPNNANTDSKSEWDSNFDPIDQDKIMIYSTRKIPILSSQEPQGHTEEWRSCPTHFRKQKLQEWSKADPDVAQSQSHTLCLLMEPWPSPSWKGHVEQALPWKGSASTTKNEVWWRNMG